MYSSFSLAAEVHEGVSFLFLQSGDEPTPSRNDVKLMENDILSTISWRMHPVTALSVARNVLGLFPSTEDDLQYQQMDDVELLIFEATRQHNLLHDTPSTIAFAAVLAASAYRNLSTGALWNLVDSIEEIDRYRVAANSTEMEKILNHQDDIVVHTLPYLFLYPSFLPS